MLLFDILLNKIFSLLRILMIVVFLLRGMSIVLVVFLRDFLMF